MLNIAMLSKWHVHAGDYANQLKQRDDVKIVAVWDEDKNRGKKWASELNADFEDDLDTLLKRNDIDAVVVNTPTSMHYDVMIAAANAGKHIFTEKIMALTSDECRKIIGAVNKNGVKFCISFPQRTYPQNLYAKKVIDEKLIGDITLLRIRNAHGGSVEKWLPDHFYNKDQCGGGAMIDLGAHPMYLIRWLLGKPARITSMFNSFTGKPVEDNAVSVIEFENKAIAISETGFVTPSSPSSLELYGTKGSLFIGGKDNEVKLYIKGEEPKTISKDEMPIALDMPIIGWINGIINNEDVVFGPQDGLELTELMEAAYKSFYEKKQVEFN